ncbi:MAG TPA: ParA family protein [Gemmatimonadota bacterium]|nr:ParA family protein [Gemmatimonadota bacterium]
MARPIAIVFANAKGGVGKTTSAVHIAGALAETGTTTLVIDLDPQASATRHLGIDPAAPGPTLTDVLIDPDGGLAHAARPTRYPRLSCVPGHESLGQMESELAGVPDREELLASAWSSDLPYEAVILDVPPALSLYTVNALRVADAVVIPVQTHPFALDSVPRTLDLIDKVRRHLNPQLVLLGYLATLYDRRTRIARECLATMEESWGKLLLEEAIPINVALAEAARDGRLLFEVDPDSAGAAAYFAVAAEIVERLSARQAERTSAVAPGSTRRAPRTAGLRGAMSESEL